MHECKCTTRDFSGQEGKKGGGGRWIVVVGHFDKYFNKSARKRDPTWKHFEVFSPRYS